MGFGSFLKDVFNPSGTAMQMFGQGMQGISDKFAGITPQDRMQDDARRRAQAEQERARAVAEAQQVKESDALNRYRDGQMTNSKLALEESRARWEASEANRIKSDARNEERYQDSIVRSDAARDQSAIQYAEGREDRQKDRTQAQENRELTRSQQLSDTNEARVYAEQLAKDKLNEASKYRPGPIPVGVMNNIMYDEYDKPRSEEEVTAGVSQWNRANFKAWQDARPAALVEAENRSAESFESAMDEPVFQAMAAKAAKARAQFERDTEANSAQAEYKKPGASQQERDEALSRENAANAGLAAFEAEQGVQADGSGEEGGGTITGGGAAEPALIEKDFSRGGTTEERDKQTEKFRKLVENIAAGDGAAAEQFDQLLNGESDEFAQLRDYYGDEMVENLRTIYRQTLGQTAPF